MKKNWAFSQLLSDSKKENRFTDFFFRNNTVETWMYQCMQLYRALENL